MFSAALLRYEINGYRVEPAYLDDRYTSLARALLLHYQAFEGKPYRDLEKALAELSSTDHHESRVIRGLRQVIEECLDLSVASPMEPKRIREAVFVLRAKDQELDPEAVYRRAAAELGLLDQPLQGYLYADLRPERLIHFSPEPLTAPEILSRYNFRLLQGLFLHAERVDIESDGNARAIYRFAKLNGLMVEARRGQGKGRELCLEISGPLSLFQHTRRYGLALARFLPACAVSERHDPTAGLTISGYSRASRSAVAIASSNRPSATSSSSSPVSQKRTPSAMKSGSPPRASTTRASSRFPFSRSAVARKPVQ